MGKVRLPEGTPGNSPWYNQVLPVQAPYEMTQALWRHDGHSREAKTEQFSFNLAEKPRTRCQNHGNELGTSWLSLDDMNGCHLNLPIPATTIGIGQDTVHVPLIPLLDHQTLRKP